MIFNSIVFLVVFLPLVLLAFHSVPPRFRLFVLTLGSVIFYGYTGGAPLVAMCVALVCAFVFAPRVIGKPIVLTVGLAIPFGMLFLFKYLDFTLDSLGAGPEVRQHFMVFLTVVLPAGISFYTFQLASYLLDSYDGKVKPTASLTKLFAYVSFFPQLIAGPIVRFDKLSHQLDRISRVRVRPQWGRALKYVSVGLFAKIFVADTFMKLENRFSATDSEQSLDALFLVLSYSFRIYYDFWAYSIIAIGLAGMFGIKLPRNFHEPYLSENPKIFWRRWHVTLSFWLRDYLYIRLGGNRAYVRNIIIVMAICGLWHGAGWNFVIWGIYHALLVLIYVNTQSAWDRLPGPFQILLTFTLITIGWPLFFSDVGAYLVLMGQIVNFTSFDADMLVYGISPWLMMVGVAGWTFCLREGIWLHSRRTQWVLESPVFHAMVVIVCVMFFRYSETFIYFRF